jgi:hypothetical protein
MGRVRNSLKIPFRQLQVYRLLLVGKKNGWPSFLFSFADSNEGKGIETEPLLTCEEFAQIVDKKV